jgi:serine/threonine protein kinase
VYRAPELLSEGAKFTNKVDIWSLGCILYELAVGRKPFVDDFAVRDHSCSGKLLDVPLEGFDEDATGTITQSIHDMLKIDPLLRPSAPTLVQRFRQICEPAKAVTDYVKVYEDFTSESSGKVHTELGPKKSASEGIS